ARIESISRHSVPSPASVFFAANIVIVAPKNTSDAIICRLENNLEGMPLRIQTWFQPIRQLVLAVAHERSGVLTPAKKTAILARNHYTPITSAYVGRLFLRHG